MKRKFSINPLPVMKRSMSKADLNSPKDIPRSPLTPLATHEEHDSKNDVCDFSQFISRRALSSQTQKELREACSYILQDLKPSGHDLEDMDPKLNFGAINRRAAGRKSTVAEIQIRKPSGAPEDMTDSYTKGRAYTSWELAARTEPVEAVQSNTSRRSADSNKNRASFAWLDDRDEKRTSKSIEHNALTLDLSRTRMHLDAMAAPRTNSTGGRSNLTSTASMSAAPTSGWSSKRVSRQLDDRALAQRQQLDRSRQPSAAEVACPPSPAQSFVNRLGRAASQESLRRADTHMSPEKRPASPDEWRSWNLPRRSNSSSSSRPSTLKVDVEEQTSIGRVEANLNRRLPPLLSLNGWRETNWTQQEEETDPLSPTAISHLHRRGGSDISMMQTVDAQPLSPTHFRPRSSYSGVTVQPRRISRKINTGAAQGHLNLMMGEWTSPTTPSFEQTNKSGVSNHARQTSADSIIASPITEISSQSLTHSRSMVLNAPPPPQQTQAPQEEQKSRLRRVFSGWMQKKERKDDWMHKIEKQGTGVKDGLLVQGSGGVTPVIRY